MTFGQFGLPGDPFRLVRRHRVVPADDLFGEPAGNGGAVFVERRDGDGDARPGRTVVFGTRGDPDCALVDLSPLLERDEREIRLSRRAGREGDRVGDRETAADFGARPAVVVGADDAFGARIGIGARKVERVPDAGFGRGEFKLPGGRIGRFRFRREGRLCDGRQLIDLNTTVR